jgi:hypothetical protein
MAEHKSQFLNPIDKVQYQSLKIGAQRPLHGPAIMIKRPMEGKVECPFLKVVALRKTMTWHLL